MRPPVPASNRGAEGQPEPLSNAEIADRLSAIARLLTAEKANPYKINAYRRGAARIRELSESIDKLVRQNRDLRVDAGIGGALSAEGISGAQSRAAAPGA